MVLPLALLVLAQSPLQDAPVPSSEPLSVAFNVRPLVREPGSPPTLAVTMRNLAGKPLDVMRFESDPCFAHFQLALALVLPDGTTPTAAGCPIRSWPGVKGTLAAGAKEERRLDLAKVFPSVKWTRGGYGIDVGWRPDALEAYFDGAYAQRSSGWSINDTRFSLVPVVGGGRVTRGELLALPDGARFKFLAHGHKTTMPGGPSSPLIIHGEFTPPGKQKAEPVEVHLQVESGRIFRVAGGYVFELVDYEYDGWMELRAFGTLPEGPTPPNRPRRPQVP